MRKELLSVLLLFQVGLEKTEQRAETFLDAAMRSGCDKDDVARRVFGKIAQEFVALMFNSPVGTAWLRRNVGLVDYD
jgi:hypothetical protein